MSALCTDELKNGSETDVDCGGPTACARCDDGRACLAGSDCGSSHCQGGVCVGPVSFTPGQGSTSILLSDSSFVDPKVLAVGDFDEDGHVDVAVSVEGEFFRGLTVRRGLGNGSVEGYDALLHALPHPADVLLTGDFDHDGHLDLAATSFLGNQLFILRGTGDGHFLDHDAHTAPPFSDLGALTSGDLDSDGNVDLVTGCQKGADVWMGKGDGTFAASVRLDAASATRALACGDFDGDGKLDLAALDALDQQVILWVGQGDGGFSPPVAIAPVDVTGSLQAADMNADGKLDLVSIGSSPARVSLLLGQGDGSFQPLVESPIGGQLGAMTVGDLDGDGQLDVASVAMLDASVSVITSQGGGQFSLGSTSVVGESPVDIGQADFDEDGRLDLVVLNSVSSDLTVLRNPGDGTFPNPRRFAPGVVDQVIGDFDGDGRDDVGALTSASKDKPASLLLLLGQGDGGLGPPLARALPSPAYRIASGDFNGDGRLDVITAAISEPVVDVSLGRSPSIDDPGLLAGTSLASTLDQRAMDVAVADVDEDGRLDVVVSFDVGSHHVSLLRGKGDGTFLEPAAIEMDSFVAKLRLADVNGDGHVDILVTSSTSPSLGVRLGHGDGTFAPVQLTPLPSVSWYLATGDLDGDGKFDVVVDTPGKHSVGVLRGHGNGTFVPPVGVPTSDVVLSLHLGDIDGDGKLDLVFGRPDGVVVALGRGDATFRAGVLFAGYPPTYSVGLGDIDHDGKLDVVTYDNVSASRAYLGVLRNTSP